MPKGGWPTATQPAAATLRNLLEDLRLPILVPANPPKPDPKLDESLEATAEIRALANDPPYMAGPPDPTSLPPMVLVFVRDAKGQTVPGILVRLKLNEDLVDHSYTNWRGAAFLRLAGATGKGPFTATIEILDPVLSAPKTQSVAFTGLGEHKVVEVVLDTLPAPPAIPSTAPLTSYFTTFGAQPPAFLLALTGHQPLDRLPPDFRPALAADLVRLLGPLEDPIFSRLKGSGDFRTRRSTLLRHVTLIIADPTPPDETASAPEAPARSSRRGDARRTAPPATAPPKKDPTKPIRRFLVRLRQEWHFLGYSLGELDSVEALDPGTVVRESAETVERMAQESLAAAERLASRTLSSTSSSLHEHATVDSVVRLASSAKVSAIAGGIGGMAGPVAFGLGGGHARASGTVTTRTNVATSLRVNANLRVATSAVNTALRTTHATRRAVESAVARAVGKVSPLLSRTTNLLRWMMYENYAVTSAVEDVVEVVDVPVVEFEPTDVATFAPETIVDLRRVFSPGLLEPSLDPQFDVLAAALAEKRADTLPISAVSCEIDCTALHARGELKVKILGQELEFQVRKGRTVLRGTIGLPVPTSALGSAKFSLRLTQSLRGALAVAGIAVNAPPASITIDRATFTFEAVPGVRREQTVHIGSELQVTDEDTTALETVVLKPPARPDVTKINPLFIHVNRNRHYYFGLLAQAAMSEPWLRDDAPQLQAFPSEHNLWKLPLLDFEGHRAIIVKPVPKDDAARKKIEEDPGAATIVQLAAPGAYGEALEGMLQLEDAAGKLHPTVLDGPASALTALSLSDPTGKLVGVLSGPNGNGDGASALMEKLKLLEEIGKSPTS